MFTSRKDLSIYHENQAHLKREPPFEPLRVSTEVAALLN